MKKYNAEFLQSISKLNPAQREAVNQIEGPVLVIAGPGTGKTQILASRIGNILMNDSAQALPENILCITYTNAGAIAMRKRLLQLIGPDAYRIKIETFHSFCNDIIQKFSSEFSYRDLTIVSEIEEIQIIREMIDKLPLNHPLKRQGSGAYYDVNRLRKLFATLKNENWSPEFISDKIKDYLTEIESNPNNQRFFYQKKYKQFNKGDKKQNELDNEKKAMEQLQAASNLFPIYNSKLSELGRYDFNDMILWVNKLFSENDTVLKTFQEKFQYILVDEYQDTNDAQNQLILHLCNFWPDPNLFVVGDDDQSIYRFQGANISNIFNFKTQYDQYLKIVMLRENYRSTQYILDASRALIEQNSERITNVSGFEMFEKKLIAANTFDESYSKPTIENYKDEFSEISNIALKVKNLIQSGTNPNEIAIIYREHKQVELLSKYFKQLDIPINLQRKINILNEPFALNILYIMNYIEKQMERPYDDDHLLYKILHAQFLNFGPPTALARFLTKWNIYKNKNSEIKSLRAFIEDFAHTNSNDQFEKQIKNNCINFSELLNRWIINSQNLTLIQQFENIITSSGALSFAINHPDKNFYLQQLQALHSFINSEQKKSNRYTISMLNNTIKIMEEYGISIESTINSTNRNGVYFTTAHSSKGLEFENVFMVGCISKYWESSKKTDSFKFPTNILSHTERLAIQMQNSPDELEIEEGRRLFYVGMTRAKKLLNLSFYNTDINGKDTIASRYISELSKHANLPIEPREVPNDLIQEVLASTLKQYIPQKIDFIDDEELNQLLSNYKLSVSHLNTYIECPIKFYYTSLLRVPVGSSPSLSFGRSVHSTLERYFKKSSDSKSFLSENDLLKTFRHEMLIRKHEFTPEEFDRRFEYGEDILKKYYNHYHKNWNLNLETEIRMEAILFENIPLKGFIDKVEINGNKIRVVDYKTGKFDKNKLKKPNPENENEKHGGDYWRQAVFYKILLDHDPISKAKGWIFQDAEFQFIEIDPKTNSFHQEVIEINSQDTDMLASQIKDIYQKIKSHQFENGCGECEWCDLIQKYHTTF